MNNRVLVTGAMGFIGGRVGQALAKVANIKVILGSRKEKNNLSWLPDTPIVAMDWSSQKSLTLACDGIDTLVHLAGMNDADCLLDPTAALEINAVNTARLMQAAKTAGVRRFIYFSTAHVYSSSLVGKIDESTLTRGLHPYATSHRAAEDIVLGASNSYMDSIVIRLSNGFGVPAHRGVNAWMLLTNDLCQQAIASKSMTLRSSGLQQRDFITLHDVARVIEHMLGLPKIDLGDGIFNVGKGQSMRVIDMARLIQMRCSEMLSFTPKITRPKPTGNEEGKQLFYCIDKLLQTGFTLNGNPNDEIDGILRMCSLLQK